MNRLAIEKYGLEFKNLLSGPAPIGRMLNYIYTAGTFELFHRNGYRSLDFNGNIGSAWATEFMIGLDLVCLGAEANDKYHLVLTPKGQSLYELLKNNYVEFGEGTTSNDIASVKKQIIRCNPLLLAKLKEVFTVSFPFIILKDYLNENGFYYESKDAFMNDLFECVKNLYDTDPTPYNRNARTPTAKNRVPSLLQLCELFDMLAVRDASLHFDEIKFNGVEKEVAIHTAEDFKKAIAKDELLFKSSAELTEKYGLDGTELRSVLLRCSSLQKIFRHDLMKLQHHKCVMCGITNEELLVGSHIKPASESSAVEKADHNNGLLLCCNHDKAFDRHLITFNFTDGQIEISSKLSAEDKALLQIDETFRLPSDLLTEERKRYLLFHNTKFIKKQEN